MASRDETLQEFLAITGASDATARQMLDSCDWALQPAVELFFATSSDLPGGTDAAAAVAAARGGAAAAMDAHRRRSSGAGGGAGGEGTSMGAGGFGDYEEEDGVRAPMPTMVDRLYGDHHHHGGGGGGGRGYGGGGGFDPHAAALHGLGRGGRSGMAALDPGPQHIDAFRPVPPAAAGGERAANAANAASAAAAAASATANAANAAGGSGNLATLFEPPTDLLFQGAFDDALDAASKQSRWLLVNVQTGAQFASHQLNRDTWRHPLVADVVRASFVFWQAYDTSPDGGRVARSYNLGHALPAVVVVDPITRAAVWSTAARRSAAGGGGAGGKGVGFVSPETLLEELAPFTDVGPSDPDAAALAARHERRVKAAAEAAAAAAMAANGGGGGGMGGGTGGGGASKASVPAEFMTEDEQLAAALAESARETAAAGGSGGGGGSDEAAGGGGSKAGTSTAAGQGAASGAAAPTAAGNGGDDDDELDEKAIWEEVARREAAARRAPPEQVAADALARLPPEPAAGAPGGCRVAVRLPDGARVARLFDGARDTIAALRDLCLAHCPEAAGGRPFALSEALPGSVPLAAEDDGRTLAQAGLANVQLVLRWAD